MHARGHKLTRDQAKEIKAAQARYMELRREIANYSAQGLALEYGVSRDVVHAIWRGDLWASA